MKKVLVFGLSSNLGGTETVFDTFYNYSDKSKYNFDFVARDGNIAFQDKYIEDGSKVFAVPDFMKNPIGYYRRIKRIMKNKNYDIAYINMLSAANILPVLAARKVGVPKIVLHSHNGNTVGVVRRVLHIINKPFLKKKGLVRVACSKGSGNFLYGNVSYEIIKNPVDYKKFKFNKKNRNEIRSRYKIKDDCFLIGAVGRLSVEKNHLFLIDVLSRMRDKKIMLMIVGDGILKKTIKQEANKVGIENMIIVVKANNDIAKYYSAFDAFVMPSLYEGLGVAGIEAQMAGLRCLFSDKVTHDVDLIENQHLCLNIDSWVDAINELVHDGMRRLKVNKGIVDEAGFDVEASVKKLFGIYEEGLDEQ